MRKSSVSPGLPCPKRGSELLDMYFLEIRSHLLEAAAGLDRIERAPGGAEALEDKRARDLLQALSELGKPGADRAERFLTLFSAPSEPPQDFSNVGAIDP
jgi:hypothetical protein